MIVRLRTWRFGIDTSVELHGSGYDFDRPNMLLTIDDPVFRHESTWDLDGIEVLPDPLYYHGKESTWTIVAGDLFDVLPCPSECSIHGSVDY